MSWLFLLRFVLPTVLLVGWVLFQLVFKKKKWKDVRNDANAALVFASVWIVLAFFFIG